MQHLKTKWHFASAVFFVSAAVLSKAAHLPFEGSSCAHTWRLPYPTGDENVAFPSSSSSSRTNIATSLGEVHPRNKENNFSEKPLPSSGNKKLAGVEMVVIQKLLNVVTRRNKEDFVVGQVQQRRGKRCRRRHSRRQKEELTGRQLSVPPRTSPGILKSNNPAMVITKDSNILRKDWCKTEPMEQQISEPGCGSKTIVNSFCYGQCNSFFIPNGELHEIPGTKNRTGASANDFRSCAVCKPRITSWVHVTLRCPELIPPTRSKRVLRVHKCRCQAELHR